VVSYSSEADSENDRLVPAAFSYRRLMQIYIDGLIAAGGTYYLKVLGKAFFFFFIIIIIMFFFITLDHSLAWLHPWALDKAFAIVRGSDTDNYGSKCNRMFVFLSDGRPGDDIVQFREKINEYKRTRPNKDNDVMGLTNAMAAFNKYAVPDIWGRMVTAAAPVFDKEKLPWSLVGVAAVDIPLCELVSAATEAGIKADPYMEEVGKTKQGCTCEKTYTWEGETVRDGECTTYDWPVPWCATTAGCGMCDLEGLEPSRCWDECEERHTVVGKVEQELRRKNGLTCNLRRGAVTQR
ncbi:hypothetical protein T484DRAFT_1766529, partial [Baffinella frigidus]